jgi:hypothetical protein
VVAGRWGRARLRGYPIVSLRVSQIPLSRPQPLSGIAAAVAAQGDIDARDGSGSAGGGGRRQGCVGMAKVVQIAAVLGHPRPSRAAIWGDATR